MIAAPGQATAKPKRRRPRRSRHTTTRIWFRGVVLGRDGEQAELAVQPGSHRTVIKRDSGATVIAYAEPRDRLDVSAGDSLLITGPAVAETMSADVIEVAGAVVTVALRGEIADDTRHVQILKLELGR